VPVGILFPEVTKVCQVDYADRSVSRSESRTFVYENYFTDCID